jgi:uncharacterized protein (DUF934 family)
MRQTNMRQIIKQRSVINDTWKYVDEDAVALAVIVPFARFLQERDQWLASTAILRVAPADDVTALKDDLTRISLIAVEFPALGEGRGYTQAQLLRRRYNFKGEIRAVGKVLRDQVFYMARCGVDAFEFPEGTDLNVALTAFDDFTIAYQSSADKGVELTQRAG